MSGDERDELAVERLRAAHEEPLAPAHYTALRARVLERVAAEDRRRRWGWLWVPVALGMSAVVMVSWPRAEVAPPPVPVAAIPAAVLEVRTSRPAVAPATPAVRTRKRVQRIAAGEPLVVKILTDDPSVVIYWVIDKKGD
jgi:hypothetical protein